MDEILLTAYSNTFPWIKILYFDWNFIEIWYRESNYQYYCVGSDKGLAAVWRQAIIWSNDGLIYWCIYASLSLSELNIENT